VDELEYIYVGRLSREGENGFEEVKDVMGKVCYKRNLEGLGWLGNINKSEDNGNAEGDGEGRDWSEVGGEWGVGGNVELIIGKGEISQN
uniref:putative inorganic carbon transporter subunit DabA n=1 Tax=Staphylococcus epidermidis TaxID=1282 RepID=UPI0011A2D383